MIKKIIKFLKKWFWEEPTKTKKQEKNKPAAEEISHAYEIIYHKGKPFQLATKQIPYFDSLDAKTKDAWVRAFNQKIKKGILVLKEIDGKKLYVKNRGIDYKKHFTK